MKDKKNKKSEMDNVRSGILISSLILISAVAFCLMGSPVVGLVLFAVLTLILVLSFLIGIVRDRNNKEYRKLNPLQKMFATVSYPWEWLGYLSSIG